MARAKILNAKSAFKPGANDATDPYATVTSAAIPVLHLKSVQYRFGVDNQNARQMASLRGECRYYKPSSTYIQRANGTGSAGQQIVLAHRSYAVREGGVAR